MHKDRENPGLAVVSSQRRLLESERCVRRLRLGKKEALGQIRNVFAESLLYVASELLPEKSDPRQLSEIVVQAFQALWLFRASMENAGTVRLFLHKSVLDSCRALHPGLDENDALLRVAFAEMARGMIETERNLPKRLQRFYRLKFLLRKTDEDIAVESGMTLEEVGRYAAEVRAMIRTMPKWG